MSGRSQGEHRQNHIENSRAQLSSNSYILFPHWDLETGRKMQSVPPTVFSGFSSAVHLVYLTSLVFLFFVFLFSFCCKLLRNRDVESSCLEAICLLLALLCQTSIFPEVIFGTLLTFQGIQKKSDIYF